MGLNMTSGPPSAIRTEYSGLTRRANDGAYPPHNAFGLLSGFPGLPMLRDPPADPEVIRKNPPGDRRAAHPAPSRFWRLDLDRGTCAVRVSLGYDSSLSFIAFGG